MEIRARVPSGETAPPRMVQLTVNSPGRRCLNSLLFPVRHADCEITSVSPERADTGSPGLELTLQGRGFIPGSTVCLNGGPRPTTFISEFELRAAISAADLASPSRADVSVRHPLQCSKALPFVIRPPRSAASEPSLDASLDPGFYIVDARLAEESLDGRWRMRVSVPAGSWPYGFHAGGVLGGKGALAWARFHLSSAQKVTVDIQAQVLHGDTGLPSLTAHLRNDAGERIGKEQSGVSTSPACTFQLSLGADAVDQDLHVEAELVPQTVGYCAFSLSQTQEVRMALQGWTLGDPGASTLELRLLDSGRNIVLSAGVGEDRQGPSTAQ
jgi:hypothetical protein